MGRTKQKLTCFFCKYEISKFNNSKKLIKYNGNLKPICKYCTKNKHKPLEIKYKDTDTQCKICKKPVMYKKCIACSVCNHFYHGKCLQLSRQDIDKIENVCDFFMCTDCNHEILPNDFYTDQHKKPVKSTQNVKSCLTCCNRGGGPTPFFPIPTLKKAKWEKNPMGKNGKKWD